MDIGNEFGNIMKEQEHIALATSVNDIPNVRIVLFIYCEETKTLFFASRKDGEKINEFSVNNNVAFTTIPKTGGKYVRGKGKVRESTKTIYDLKEIFVTKYPRMESVIDNFGNALDLFEIPLTEVTVTLDMQETHKFAL